MNIPIFDLHCDTVMAMTGRDLQKNGELKANQGQIDLERAATLPGYAQCFACYTSTWKNLPDNITVEDVFERQLAVILHEIEKNNDVIRQAFTADDIEKNRQNGLMSAILTCEGTVGFGCDPALLEDLYRIGFRITSLGWNEKNALTGSHVTGGGLTDQGREFVKEAQRLGMLIDVSHISDEGFWDVMDITQAPILATHSNSRSVCNSTRNLSDDMFCAICQTGGVAGFNQYAAFVGDPPTMDAACKHILHFLELDSNGSHIALGGDLDGCDILVEGITGIQDYPKLSEYLLQRGLDEKTVYDIFWNNALGVIKRCCM